jgi:hypothetical protein
MPFTLEDPNVVQLTPQPHPCDFSAGDPVALRAQALRCRRLCDSIGDRRTLEALSTMAADYEARARLLESRES